MRKYKRQEGFTLPELLISVLLLGVVAMALSPVLGSLATASKRAYQEKHRLNNQLIGSGLMSYASGSLLGRLPAPVSFGSFRNTIYNPANATPDGVAISNALIQTGVNTAEINADGTAASNVRVYQLVQPAPMPTPLYFQSGPQVLLRYDFGAIYLTECPVLSSGCNPNGATGVPGSTTPALSAANYASWNTSGTDSAPFFVSSLPIQKMMLSTTVQRLERVRESMLSFLRVQQLTASGSDSTNWYPNHNGLSAPGGSVTNTPLLNQGCRDGWYRLNDATSKVLLTVGLAPEEYGVTAWGGAIEYCRDYDPTDAQAPDAPPHYAAIRFLADVSMGSVPNNAIPGNNVVLTF